MSELIRKNVNFPSDWIEAIDTARGNQSFGDFVRAAVLAQLTPKDRKRISEMPNWGQGRPRKSAE